MGKSILVMDTPEYCLRCCVRDGYSCGRTKFPIRGEDLCKKPDWCPLQDAPEKKDKNPYHNEHESGYVDGWNDCIDQILNGG